MRLFNISSFFLGLLSLTGCVGNMNPTGGNSTPDYPYFITKQPLLVKKILVPAGTTLTYKESTFKKGKLDKLMDEKKLIKIEFPAGETMDWAGVPITSIWRFANSEMRGFSVYADFSLLPDERKIKFAKLWQGCSSDLGITVKNIDDWSFNKNNISDIQSCSVNYQRYFKDNAEQQQFLDDLYAELMKVEGGRN